MMILCDDRDMDRENARHAYSIAHSNADRHAYAAPMYSYSQTEHTGARTRRTTGPDGSVYAPPYTPLIVYYAVRGCAVCAGPGAARDAITAVRVYILSIEHSLAGHVVLHA